MTEATRGSRGTIFRLKIILFSVVPIALILVCGEWGVRWFSYTFQSANVRYQVHRELRYTLRKGYRIDQEGEPYESSNRFGFRGSADMRRDKGNRFRIVTIGDSVTFGLGVSDSETYPQQLEELLNW